MKDNSKTTASCQMEAVFVVYVIWCQKTNMYCVGVTSQKPSRRIHQHKRGKQFIDREIQRLGWESNFDWWIVEENVSSNLISEREQHWVAFFDSVHPNGYNKTCGGIGNFTVSEDTCAKLRQIAQERDYSGEKNPHYGKHHTDESKEKNRQAHLGKPSWNKGIPCAESTKAILREKALARNAAKRAAKAAQMTL